MALRIAEDEHFKTIKKILKDTTIDENNVIKKGLKKAAEVLKLFLEPDSRQKIAVK
jgi:predicted nucleotide-binding protein (sugar kinase/HSP70/actin superfamily)